MGPYLGVSQDGVTLKWTVVLWVPFKPTQETTTKRHPHFDTPRVSRVPFTKLTAPVSPPSLPEMTRSACQVKQTNKKAAPICESADRSLGRNKQTKK